MRLLEFPKSGLSCRLPDDLLGSVNIGSDARLEVSILEGLVWVDLRVRREQRDGQMAWETAIAEGHDPELMSESKLVELIDAVLAD